MFPNDDMTEVTGKENITKLKAEIRELKKDLKKRDSEIKSLKANGKKPSKKDIISILKCLGVEISKGKQSQFHEFWLEVIYPSRFSKRGLARKEMVWLCGEIGHPWGTEPIRQAIKLLLANGILKKKGTHYPVDMERLLEIAE